MKLAHAFMMERRGHETREARRIKFFARDWYYSKMARDPEFGLHIAARMQWADREVRNAELACPVGNGDFRHFLLAFDGAPHLEQRVRLMKETVIQVHDAAWRFNSFSVKGPWMLKFSIDVAKTPPEELPMVSASASFQTRTEKLANGEATVCTDISVDLKPRKTPAQCNDPGISKIWWDIIDSTGKLRMLSLARERFLACFSSGAVRR